jgi:hypothetical protein
LLLKLLLELLLLLLLKFGVFLRRGRCVRELCGHVRTLPRGRLLALQRLAPARVGGVVVRAPLRPLSLSLSLARSAGLQWPRGVAEAIADAVAEATVGAAVGVAVAEGIAEAIGVAVAEGIAEAIGVAIAEGVA